jgi:hypothetical protein
MTPKLDFSDDHPKPFVLSVRDTIVPKSDTLHLDRSLVESQVVRHEESTGRIPSKRAERTALMAKLTKAMVEHIRAAYDHAYATQRQRGVPDLLPRPTERQLASLLDVSQPSVHRCLVDGTARELQHLWKLAIDLDRIMLGGNFHHAN